ncbi:3-mercaptopyruvate sulfurtransferase [Posidoniimonas corsicana]|uniref:3-mercaptopyruvate sulfurtransferase n=1 Tax=Posidoniimonas corsicana TaxID=1938618 RepID=A0A5C5UVD3_9BACT|nr:sulfurtransferase [Posidoniimonas corsicana]TWT29335.1 3-mercaptopyruvate sulfurtransferase [Posidoniimonas corsicana]
MTHTAIISPQDARARIDDPSWVFIDCRFSLADPDAGQRAYANGHLPGAVYAHLDEHLSSPVTETSGRHPLPDAARLAAQLGDWGVGHGIQVVAYDDASGAFAARLWWLLHWLGHSEVAVLDGGFEAWQSLGLPTTAVQSKPRPVAFSGTPDDAMWITSDATETALAGGDALLIDARGPERFRGELEPVDPVAGHVPGAVNAPFAGNLNDQGRLLPAGDLRARFAPLAEQAGADGVIHMCGSGVTACHNMLAMAAAGLPMGRLYAGSWSEWIRNPDRAVASGS